MKTKMIDPQLLPERRLGLATTTLAGVGGILGAGIYVLIGIAAGQAGNAVWLSFFFASAAAGLTGISYARLVRLRPKDAPEFHYVGMAFGRRLGFLAGWLVLWARIISVALVSLGFAGYLFRLTGLPLLPSTLGLILFATLILFLGVGESTFLVGVLTVVEILGLVLIIAIGTPYLGRFDFLEMPGGISGVIGASSLVFFVYLGFQDMVNFAEEMQNPQRDLPKAIVLALAICTFFYILVSLAAISVLGWEELSRSKAPLAEVAAKGLGPNADYTLTSIALASTANTAIIMLFAASRSIWAMSCAEVLPGIFCRISRKRRTPWTAVFAAGLLACLFTLIKNIESAAQAANFSILLAFCLVNASAARLFGSKGSDLGIRHMVTDLLLPGAGVAVCLWLASKTGWFAALLGAGLLLAGTLLYWVMAWKPRQEDG